MSRKNSGEKELHWRKILQRQADSGLSVRKFCATEGISEPSFYAWKKKLRERKNVTRRGKTSRRPDGRGQEQLFVPLQLIDAAASLEIIHPLGYRIQVAGDVNPVALRHVIETLDARGVR